MAQDDKGRIDLDLKVSICTDNPTGTDIYKPGDSEAQHVSQTGIERQGGITPIYENLVGLLDGAIAGSGGIVTSDGKVIAVVSDEVSLSDFGNENLNLGNVGPLTVYKRGALPGYLDAAWTIDNTIITITRRAGTIISVYEISPLTGAVLNSRDINFGALVTANIKTLSLIRYVDMHYADNQEFYLRYYATTQDQILKEAGTTITKVATNTVDYANFAHRFAANRYIWGEQGKVSSWQVGDIFFGGAGYTVQTNAKWCVIDRWYHLADSRAVLTFDVYKDAGNTLTGISTVGYDGAGGWSAAVTDKGLALAAVVPTISNKINGPGWSEATYIRSDTGTNIYSYIATKLTHNAAAYYDVVQTQTQTPMNGYGKLTDIDGNHTFTVNWKVIMVNGVPSMIAAAPISASTVNDHLGVPITNLGEFDPFYISHCIEWDDPVLAGVVNSAIIYRYNGTLFYVWVSPTAAGRGHSVEKISDTVYQVNCLSPINLVDTTKKTLQLGANDYNGRLRWSSVGAITTVSKMSSVISGNYSNSVDVGDKLVTLTVASGVGIPYGIEQPVFWTGAPAYSVKIFSADLYFQSAFTEGAFFTDLTLANLLYIADTRLPIAMGYTYGTRCAFTDFSTIFTGVGVLGSTDVDYGYTGYELGNQTLGLMDVFVLFGERYLFDDFDVWRASFNGPIYAGKTYVATARGMRFIAYSSTLAYFLSAFDNSIWAFDGGRALAKLHRFNDVETIIDGVYSLRDGTLLLQTLNTLIWIRDSVISQHAKSTTDWSAAATPYATIGLGALRMFDTQSGIVLWVVPTSASLVGALWTYTFELPTALLGTTLPYPIPVPFVFQSAYFGVLNNILMVVNAYDVTLFNPAKSAMQITLTYNSLDADGAQAQTPAHITINPVDWSALGIYRCRLIPAQTKVIAASIGVQFTVKAVLTGIAMEWTEDAPAVPANTRSV